MSDDEEEEEEEEHRREDENEDGVKGVRWQLGGVSFSAFLIAFRGLLSDPGTAAAISNRANLLRFF